MKLAYFPFDVKVCTVRNVFKIDIHTFNPLTFYFSVPKGS